MSSIGQKFQHGVDLHRQGKTGQAAKIFKSILQAHPKHSDALNQLGLIAYRKGDVESAAALFEQSVKADPRNFSAIQNLGNVRVEQNRLGEAESCYRTVIEHSPEDGELQANMCVLLRKGGRFDEAIHAGRQSTSLAPDHPVTWYSLAMAYIAKGQDRKALASLEKAVSLKPDFTIAHNMLCQASYRLEAKQWLGPRGYPKTRLAYQSWYENDRQNPVAEFMLQALAGGDAIDRPPDNVTRRIFDDFAEQFEQQLTKLQYRGPELVSSVLQRHLHDQRELDVVDGGCGTGLMAPHLRPRARKLEGIDLSPEMLARAERTGLYDALHQAELSQWLTAHPDCCDLLTIVDTFCYFGALEPALASARTALRPGALVAFTLEKLESAKSPGGWVLHPTGRYSHTRTYAENAVIRTGLELIEIEEHVLRNENGSPVWGLIATSRKPYE